MKDPALKNKMESPERRHLAPTTGFYMHTAVNTCTTRSNEERSRTTVINSITLLALLPCRKRRPEMSQPGVCLRAQQ